MTNIQTLITETYQYVGQIQDGLKSGKGVLVFNDGSYYIGDFSKDKFHGQSTYTLPDVQMYGSFKNGDFYTGQLVIDGKSNEIYYGDYKKLLKIKSNLYDELQQRQPVEKQINIIDLCDIKSKLNYKDGILVETTNTSFIQVNITPSYIYVGKLVNGQMSGLGTLVFNDGSSIYYGEFVQNRFSGSGTFTNKLGTQMSGKFYDSDFYQGDLSMTKGSKVIKVTNSMWQQHFLNQAELGTKKLQDYYTKKQDKNKQINITDSQRKNITIQFENGFIKQNKSESLNSNNTPQQQLVSVQNNSYKSPQSAKTVQKKERYIQYTNILEQQINIKSEAQKTLQENEKKQLNLEQNKLNITKSYSPVSFDNQKQSDLQNKLQQQENEISSLKIKNAKLNEEIKLQTEKQTEEISILKNEAKDAQNELILKANKTIEEQNTKVQELNETIDLLQQQKGTADKERQKYVKLQAEIEELKKQKQQLITNQAKLYNKEQLEDEVQKRVQTETDIIYKQTKEIIKQKTDEVQKGYQASYNQEMLKIKQIEIELNKERETQKQDYEQQLTEIQLQLKIAQQEKVNQQQKFDQKCEDLQKQYKDSLQNNNQLKLVLKEKENQEQIYRAKILDDKALLTQQLTNQFNQQLAAQQQQFESQIQLMSQQNQSTMQQYQQQLQVYQQQLQACQIEKQNVQVNAQQYSVTVQNEAKQWIDKETARITTEFRINQQKEINQIKEYQTRQEKQYIRLQSVNENTELIAKLQDNLIKILIQERFTVDWSHYPPSSTEQDINQFNTEIQRAKQICDNIKMHFDVETDDQVSQINFEIQDSSDKNYQNLHNTLNTEDIAKISISIGESMIEDQLEQVKQNQDKQILINLKEFPEDIAPKLIKTLKKQFPDMISADVTEDFNVLVTAKQEDVEETAKTIRRLKILEKRLTCTIVNKDGKKDEKKNANTK
ncbi:Phosphatidylinositol-4-phosphate_5-kinase [Hexamita inflata]|uniref:Putative n=1 Tax=Hexamita inflata TaxID=28002 RepID=A0AA86N9F0_9EUKA|nr:Phosphatidylinositol-4-phosphate 5-kinase [Hexamita inflata]